MALPGDKVFNSCLSFGEPQQKLLATVLIVLGLFALLDYAVKLIALVWIHLLPFLNRICDTCFQKGGRLLKALRVFSSTKRLWKGSTLVRNRKKASDLRFRCIVDPVKLTVRMGKPREAKACWTQAGRKNKACYSGEWSSRNDDDNKKTSWHRNQPCHQSSPCSSRLSGTETPQPACPAGSVASWVRFSFSSPEHVADAGSSSTHYNAQARSHQRATGDKQPSSEVAGEHNHGQRFLPHSVGFNTDKAAPCHLEPPHEQLNPQGSETNFIPSPILSGPRRVVYSALASDAASRTRFHSDSYTYPHSPRGPQHSLGLEWHPRLPVAQQAEVYVYLVSPPPPSPEHNPEQLERPFSPPQTISGKDGLANRISLSQSKGNSGQGPAVHGSSEAHKQRKSIWERKHQKRPLQPNTDYEKLAGSSGGGHLAHLDPFPHNSSLLADRGRGGPEAPSPTLGS
ncbi:hypothetical protein JRQ81_014260 [Phrynocephalus forsythii]|uniref:Uncharacterized protein n=1 Tax=Phrynocephalus forsythii TaxID=171643 RepID=A0A9Q0XY99_9SAUR|nr:hypothetical protein JRQ81_014260 [Phrynocephalus forsythii]